MLKKWLARRSAGGWPLVAMAVALAALVIVAPNRSTPSEASATDLAVLANAVAQAGAATTDQSPATVAAGTYFLKVDGIPGESTDAGHKDEIDILSWSWGQTNATKSGDIIVRKPAFTDVTFSMQTSKASPLLFLAGAQGKVIKQAVLTARKGGERPVDYLTITFSDVVVSSYQAGSGSGSSVLPADQLSLNFGKIVIEYRVQNPDGSQGGVIKAGWDLRRNVAI